MSIGDLVITINSGILMIGRITGHPRIDRTAVKVVWDEEQKICTLKCHSLCDEMWSYGDFWCMRNEEKAAHPLL